MEADYRSAAKMRRHSIDGGLILEPIGPLHAVSAAAAASAPGKVSAVCGSLVELIPGGQPWPPSLVGAGGSCPACARLTGPTLLE